VFESLDFVYTPVADVDAAARDWVETLGGELVWKVSAFGTVVACVRAAADGPFVLLTDHLEGDVPILVYRVASYAETVVRLRDAGVELEELEIPHGPCASFRLDGKRFAVYELTRPEAVHRFDGRFDD